MRTFRIATIAAGVALVATMLAVYTTNPSSVANAKRTGPGGTKTRVADAQVKHRVVEIDGQSIFYREAGRRDAPTILLLHGFPTSSHMFRNLIPVLADQFHLVAPDYPGYGNSSMPPVGEFDYTFDNFATIVEKFTEQLGLKKQFIQ